MHSSKSLGILCLLVIISSTWSSAFQTDSQNQETMLPIFAKVVETFRLSSSSVTSTSTTTSSASSEEKGKEKPELVQLFVYSRHGAATDYHFLYDGEWKPYKIQRTDDFHEKLTPLGAAQCWSMGRRLAMDFSDFVDSSIESESFLLNTINLNKNRKCTNYMWFGIQNFIPNIGHFSDEVVADAMSKRGNCYNCFSDSQFPFEESQEVSEDLNNSDYWTDNIQVHPMNFLDYDDVCKTKEKFLDLSTDNLPLSDVKLIKKISPYYQHNDFDAYSVIQELFKHLYHGIPLEHGLENATDMFVKRSLKLKDGITERFLVSILDVHENKWTLPALYARAIIKEMREKLDSQDYALNIYPVHNNNLISLIIFLIGAKSEREHYITYYASTALILVFYDSESDSKYVNLRFKGEDLEIRDCGFDCDYDTFLSLLDEYSELGGDLKEFCWPKEFRKHSSVVIE